MKQYKKKYLSKNVYEIALERYRLLFERYDNVVISFSGGKDSCVVLNLALEVARELDRFPLEVYFEDEEVVPLETVEYCERIRQSPEINFHWLCLPMLHRNACSFEKPFWYAWNPEEQHLWVRELPENAITHLPGFRLGMEKEDIGPLLYPAEKGTVVCVRGLRAAESVRRYRAVGGNRTDNWITKYPLKIKNFSKPRKPSGKYAETLCPWFYSASPIYDWQTEDIWIAIRSRGWDYNRAYDRMSSAGILPHLQRTSNPFGEEPIKHLRYYAELWPDLWAKMLARVPGVNSAMRYGDSALYGAGSFSLPPGKTFKDLTFSYLEKWPPEYKAKILYGLKDCIKTHQKKTSRPISDSLPDPLTGCSWQFLFKLVIRGDMALRASGNMTNQSEKTLRRLGLSPSEVVKMPEEELTQRLNAYLSNGDTSAK